jgi:regulator of protease activity HflC (stomatin/prohibitin superfamily)
MIRINLLKSRENKPKSKPRLDKIKKVLIEKPVSMGTVTTNASIEGIRRLWKNNLFYTLFWLFIGVSAISMIIPKNYGNTAKLLIASAPILLFLLILCLIISGALILTAVTVKTAREAELKEKQKLLGGIFRNVPANQVWVLRNAWFSNPETEIGYVAKKEGWRFYVPYLWHIDMGFVDLSPKPRDPESIIVNTKDNQTAIIDWRIVTVVSDAVKFAIKVNGNREKFETQQATVAINQIASEDTQEALTSIETNELQIMGEKITKLFNQLMHSLDVGIEATVIEIQKILPPEEIRAAAEYATVSQKRKEVATTKGEELKIIKDATGADPTKLVIAEMIRAGLTDLVDPVINAFITRRETKEKEIEEEGGEKK